MDPRNANSKTELVMFLQRFIGRSLTKEDVVYTTVSIAEQFQSTVKLVCHNDEEFVGEVGNTDKESTQSAAQQVLDAYAAEIAALPPVVKTNKKRDREKKVKEPAMSTELSSPGLSVKRGGDRQSGDDLPRGMRDEDNCKSQLVQALQTHCKRAMTKADVLYESVKVGDLYQSTVTLQCVQLMAFVGEPASSEKAAEHAAAQQAMVGQSQWLETSGAPAPAQQKRKVPDPVNPKSELVMFLQGYTKKALQKADIVYTCVTGGTLMQATVTLNCLGGQAFAGEPCSNQKAAEASAAEQALRAYASHVPQVKALQKLGGGGRGPTAKRQALMASPAMTTATRGGRSFTGVIPPRGGISVGGHAPPKGKGKGGGGGGGGAGGNRNAPPSGNRDVLNEGPILGEVVEWKDAGGWGYLRPHAPISNPLANQQKDGKIYVHKQDLSNATDLAPGSLVQFNLYQDAKGVGACEVMVF